ncbi:hypothetical protein DFH76_003746 [Clostridium beijerinckii]|nr:hypothetical protein [Clostridium beijerinckii]
MKMIKRVTFIVLMSLMINIFISAVTGDSFIESRTIYAAEVNNKVDIETGNNTNFYDENKSKQSSENEVNIDELGEVRKKKLIRYMNI